MKKLISLVAILATIMPLLAQVTSGGPDAYGYTWRNNDDTGSAPQFQWFDITTIGTQVTGLTDDNVVGPFSVSSGFQFYWYPTNQFWIGSNGYVSFAGDNIASPFPAAIPLSSGANDFLAPFLSDLNFSGLGNPAACYYYSNTDTLCISYHNVPYWTSLGNNWTGSNTFQIIFNKSDFSITYNFLSSSMGTNTSVDMAIGIENVSGTLGLGVAFDSVPDDSATIKFYYPSVVTFAVTDGGIGWTGNPKSAGIFVKSLGDPISLNANIRNFGNQALGSFSANDTVFEVGGSGVTGGSITIPALGVGKDTNVTFPNQFSAPNDGIFIYESYTSGITGDLTASNNALQMEVVAIDTTQTTMTLEYTDESPDGAGLGWNGGNGGIGIYIEPPFYPAKIVSSRFHITTTGTAGFFAKIYDDDGTNGGPGTLLDSNFVGTSAITLNDYTTVPVDSDYLVIDSGGVYLLWLMAGAGINLGRDLTAPFSRQTYEVLAGSWAEYRDRLTEDFLLGLNVEYTFPVADFSMNATLDPQINFTDLTSNKPNKWQWDFGDGTPLDTNQHTSHTYTENGTYTVCLKVWNNLGVDSVCKDITIQGLVPVVDFDIDYTNTPFIVFSDKSTNMPTSWVWDFDDNGDTSHLQDPWHLYSNDGTYNVCLVATNVAGPGDTTCKDVVVATTVGVTNYQNQEITLFPNPVIDYLTLELSKGFLSATFQVYDLSGKLMFTQRLQNSREVVDLNTVPAGIYNYRLTVDDQLFNGRFVKSVQ